MNRLLGTVFGLVVLVTGLGAFPMPSPLETGHLLGKNLPSGSPPVPLADELYALGWSPSNAFAFLERRTGVTGPTVVRFCVLDLVEDSILYETEWPDWGAEGDREAWWTDREAEFTRVFAQFQLEPTDRQLGLFPLIMDNEYDTLSLRLGRDPVEPSWITRLEIVLHSTGRGLKTVGAEAGFWRWATLLGFVPSPFENRVALILLVQPVGWSGNRQPLRFLVAGLSLKAGFPKP